MCSVANELLVDVVSKCKKKFEKLTLKLIILRILLGISHELLYKNLEKVEKSSKSTNFRKNNDENTYKKIANPSNIDYIFLQIFMNYFNGKN